MNPDHNEACYLFGEVVAQIFEPLIELSNTFRYITRALDFSESKLASEDADQYLQFALDRENRKYFGNLMELVDGSYRERIGGVVAGQLQTIKRRVASASLVFAHTIFESCVSDCLMIIFHAAPDDWLNTIQSRKVTLADIAAAGIESIQCETIRSHIQSLEKESLLKKLDVFFIVARPDGPSRIRGYTYDRSKIEAIDQARHTAAHGSSIAYDPDSLKDDIEYLRSTIMHLLSILIDRYGVRTEHRPLAAPDGSGDTDDISD